VADERISDKKLSEMREEGKALDRIMQDFYDFTKKNVAIPISEILPDWGESPYRQPPEEKPVRRGNVLHGTNCND
jgi:hypothetical protein